MRSVQFTLLSAIGMAQTAAFVPPSHPKNPTVLAALDPSILSDPTVLIGVAGAAGAAIVAAITGKGANGKTVKKAASSKPGKVDLSIPYDAAATLAYNAYAISSTKKVNFDKFQALYVSQIVAMVKAKTKVGKVTEKKTVVDAMQKKLAALEAELAGLEGNVAGLNGEAAEYTSQIEELFGAVLEAAPTAAASPSGVDL